VAEDGKKALHIAQGTDEIDVVVTDLLMPGLDGLGFIEGLRVVRPEVPTILISAFANMETAVKAGRRGVHEVLEKPIRLRDVRRAIKRAMKGVTGWTAPEIVRPDKKKVASKPELSQGRLIGRSPAFLEVMDLIARVAPVSSTVLLLGESGTGKELIARALHEKSPRATGPHVRVACAALAEGVLEAELFGNERGAYTGAHEQRKGRFELAHCGTLFLDEIGELSLPLQVKLLRVLQEGEFERVGGTKTIKTDVRVIAATNRDLQNEVREGRFREDLFWRLNVIAMSVPPLRERNGDVVELAEYFLQKILKETERVRPSGIEPDVLACLRAHSWPGNVRELENTIERAIVLARGETITMADLPESVREEGGGEKPLAGVIRFEVGQSLAALEREAIVSTLRAVGGNRETAASILGIGTATLYRRLKEIDLEDGTAASEDDASPAGDGVETQSAQPPTPDAEGPSADDAPSTES
jgi:DNA-binding NtrC family response regulator